ncbi:MAG TPA: pyridoxal phosphate-dependent aminotransferase [Bacteroidota bacterium]|nr:pyridoxal phosphate-dependent aminotransferase [Bacteroidota bacterium]
MRLLSAKVQALKESKTLALSARAKRMKAEGIDVVSLTAGEPDFPTPEAIKKAAIQAINENFTKYTANAGMPELLKAIAEKLRRENNIRVEPSGVIVSNGAKHSVYNALQAICDRGDEVLIPAPYWVSYPEIAKLVDAKPVILRTNPADQFKLTPKQLRKAIGRRSRVLILNSPCNPTGAVYTPEEIEALAEVVEASKLFVISDEIYEKVLYDGARHFSIGSIETLRDRVITVNGVSKAFSMTGWRIGYAAGQTNIIAAMDKIQGQVTSNASSISQRAALSALTNNLEREIESMVREFGRRRRFLIEEFRKIDGISFVHPSGAFYLFFNVKSYLGVRNKALRFNNADDLCEHFLVQHKVAMVPGTSFGAKEWVRISYACSMDELRKGVERLQSGFSQLQRG